MGRTPKKRISCVALTQRVVRATKCVHSFIPSDDTGRRRVTGDDDESVDVCADDNVRDDDGGDDDDADDIVGITHRTTTNGNGNGKWRFG